MSLAINKLTARQVEKINKPGRHSDGGNLYPSVSKNGSRRWVFFYRYNSRQREMGLGSASQAGVALVRARKLSAQARVLLQAGIDPLEARRQEPWREDRQRYQTGHLQALFIRRKDPDRFGRTAR